LHPSVSQALRVWSTTVGRDKTYRAIQYFARFYAWWLLRRSADNKFTAAQWNSLKSALGNGRKMLRLFKPIEHLQAALSTPNSPVLFEYVSSVARQLSYAGYLTFDAVVWMNAVKFMALEKETAARVNKISQRFWLAGIVFSVAAGMSKMNRQIKNVKKLKSASRTAEKANADTMREEIKTLKTQIGAARYQLIQDLLDFWLPASNLEYVHINDGVAGIIGVITSLMAFNLSWKAAAAKK